MLVGLGAGLADAEAGAEGALAVPAIKGFAAGLDDARGGGGADEADAGAAVIDGADATTTGAGELATLGASPVTSAPVVGLRAGARINIATPTPPTSTMSAAIAAINQNALGGFCGESVTAASVAS